MQIKVLGHSSEYSLCSRKGKDERAKRGIGRPATQAKVNTAPLFSFVVRLVLKKFNKCFVANLLIINVNWERARSKTTVSIFLSISPVFKVSADGSALELCYGICRACVARFMIPTCFLFLD